MITSSGVTVKLTKDQLQFIFGCSPETYDGRELVGVKNCIPDDLEWVYNHLGYWIQAEGLTNKWIVAVLSDKKTQIDELFEFGVCWLHSDEDANDEALSEMVTGFKGGDIFANGSYWTLKELADSNHRWSNNPLTKFSDANELFA